MSLAKLIHVPVIGNLVRRIASNYGKRFHNGYVITQHEAEQIIDAAKTIAIGPCACRHVFHNCDVLEPSEIVIGLGATVFPEVRPGEFTMATIEEAKTLLRQCHQRKLVHTVEKCMDNFYAICNCCTCCCVPLRLQRNYHVGSALIRRKDIVPAVINGLL